MTEKKQENLNLSHVEKPWRIKLIWMWLHLSNLTVDVTYSKANA